MTIKSMWIGQTYTHTWLYACVGAVFLVIIKIPWEQELYLLPLYLLFVLHFTSYCFLYNTKRYCLTCVCCIKKFCKEGSYVGYNGVEGEGQVEKHDTNLCLYSLGANIFFLGLKSLGSTSINLLESWPIRNLNFSKDDKACAWTAVMQNRKWKI